MSPQRQALDELADALDEPIVVATGFDDALLGTAEVFCGHSWSYRAIYDQAKCIQILVTRDGMTEEEAEEYFQFNVRGAIVPGSPIYLELLPTDGPVQATPQPAA
jgi:hypothetical protein